MKRLIALITIISATVGATGCNMCCGPYDYDYPTYGGKFTRADARYGRVGSIFSDPNAKRGGPDADSNLTPMTEPNRRALDGGLEQIEPLEGSQPDPVPGQLPVPDAQEGNGPTASRLLKNQPLRSSSNIRR